MKNYFLHKFSILFYNKNGLNYLFGCVIKNYLLKNSIKILALVDKYGVFKESIKK
jgi:hypothetical protein